MQPPLVTPIGQPKHAAIVDALAPDIGQKLNIQGLIPWGGAVNRFG
jgi:hypothetical protein